MYRVSVPVHFVLNCLAYLLSPLPAAAYLVVRRTESFPREGIDAPLIGSVHDAIVFLVILAAGVAVAWSVPRFVVVARCPRCDGRARYDAKAPPDGMTMYRCTACGECISTGWAAGGGGMP